uniref:Vacuolar protein sorting-associated protein n=1 Tax=Parastrongyloides trichosuri TaxID=131310 RepID=A0A0N4ZHA3_PARTI
MIMEEEVKAVEYIRKYNISLLSSVFNKVQGSKGICCDSVQEKAMLSTISFKEMITLFGLKGGISLYKPFAPAVDHIFYFISDSGESYDLVERHIQVQDKNSELKNIFVFIVANGVSSLKAKIKGLVKSSKHVEVNEFPLYWICYDSMTISLYESNVPKQLLVQHKPAILHRNAVALLQLEKLTGTKLVVRAKGEWATKVAEIMMHNRESELGKKRTIVEQSLDLKEVIIMDRWLDPITPLLIPMTFDALISEFFPTEINGTVSVDRKEFDKVDELKENEKPIKNLKLNDEIYNNIADSHISAIGVQLSELSKELFSEESNFKESMKVIAAWKMTMPKLQNIVTRKELCTKYIRLAEMIYDRKGDDFIYEFLFLQMDILNGSIGGDKVITFLEDSLIRKECLYRCLRLICLQSIVNNGLRPQVINAYKRLILNNYGTEKLQFFVRLQVCNLITERETSLLLSKSVVNSKIHSKYPKIDFGSLKKFYKLFDGVTSNEVYRKDPLYAFNGYAPLLYRILEHGINTDWGDWNTYADTHMKQQELKTLYTSNKLLFVIGGITKAEMSLLKSFQPIITLIGSTDIVSGNSFMKSFEV